jgi:tRNA(Arg) A34 adenosine deaminase TadA
MTGSKTIGGSAVLGPRDLPFCSHYNHSALVTFIEAELAVTATDFMRLAIRVAQDGIAAGQTPFGAVVILGDQVVSSAHNTVWRDCNPTAHAEINAIREAAAKLGRIDLTGGAMYTTCEPCPMCLSAIHWSKLDAVYYGASIADAQSAGFCELCVDAERLAKLGGSRLQVIQGPLRAACADLFAQWKAAGLSKPY